MSSKGSKKKKSVTLKIGSSLTIEQTPEFTNKFNDALASGSGIKIETETIEILDQSGIQLLLEIINQKNRIPGLSLKFSDTTQDLLTKCGLIEYFK